MPRQLDVQHGLEEIAAAMELYGALILLELLHRRMSTPSVFKVLIPQVGTDNQGNAITILNTRTKTWPSSIMIMQMVWFAHDSNIEPGVRHKLREMNKWADQLAGGDPSGFTDSKRLSLKMDVSTWDMLHLFAEEEAIKSVNAMEKRKK